MWKCHIHQPIKAAKRFSQETINNSPVISKLTLRAEVPNTSAKLRQSRDSLERQQRVRTDIATKRVERKAGK